MTARNPLGEFVRRILLLETPYGDIHDRQELFENFAQLPGINADIGVSKNLNFEILGAGTPLSAQQAFNANGGITITTDTASAADGDQAYLWPHQDTLQTAWAIGLTPNEQPRFETVIELNSVEDIVVWAGLKLTGVADEATDTDSAYFLLDVNGDYVTASANWQVNVSVNGTDTTVDTGVPATTDTTVRLGVTVGSDLKARFYINGHLVHTAATAFDGPEALLPVVGVETDTTAAKSLDVYYIRVNRLLP